jgi:hypothetical protein
MLWTGPVFAAGSLAWVERSTTELELQEGGQAVFVYRHGEGRDCCYLSPLVSPKGVVLTDDGPADHPHHRGMFWAWPVVEVNGKRADLWTRKGIGHRFERIVSKHARGKAAGFQAEHSWVLDGVAIVRESLAVTANATDAAGRRTLDIQLTLVVVDKPVRIAGAPEQGKGYGGLSVRYAPRQATTLRTSEGLLAKDEDHGAHQWVEFTGAFAKGRAGLRFIADPANPGFPNEWCLRHYGFTGATYPGVTGRVLEPGLRVTFRYRIEVFDFSVEQTR